MLIYLCHNITKLMSELKEISIIVEGNTHHYQINERKLKHGIYTVYDEDGHILEAHEYKNDIKDGAYCVYRLVGYNKLLFKTSEGTYKNGKLDGLTTIWYNNTTTGNEIIYKDGIKIKEIDYFRDGIKHGEYEYDPVKKFGKKTTYACCTKKKTAEFHFRNIKHLSCDVLEGECKNWDGKDNLTYWRYHFYLSSNSTFKIVDIKDKIFGFRSLIKLINNKKKRWFFKCIMEQQNLISKIQNDHITFQLIMEYLNHEDIKNILEKIKKEIVFVI
jgi:antitoxin component YwqK of YwqJK toxin-antitoxin module